MKYHPIRRRSVLWLIALGFALRLQAQQFIVQHSFTNSPDGSNPGTLSLVDGAIYGSSPNGGASNNGVVFRLGSNGTGYAATYSFPGDTNGASPNEVLVSGSTVYGTTYVGGSSGYGTVFSMNTNGTGITTLYNFTNLPDAEYPLGGLLLSGGTLYGTTASGGSAGNGTVFKLNTNGTGYTVLHSFTNSPDGATPRAGLVLNGATMYGTTASGGANGNGSVFKLTTNGTGYTIIYSFSNSPDAQIPYATLVFSSNLLYGSASYGGSNNSGAVFKLGTNGAGYAVLHSFTGPTSPATNSDGATPKAALLVNGATLYGTTVGGGSGNHGTVFQMNTNGSGFAVLKNFTTAPDGVNPQGGLVLTNKQLWGTTLYGGSANSGTVFSLQLSPVITNQPQNLTVTNGNPAAFTNAATGAGPLYWQWYFNTNTPVVGGTNAVLLIASAATNQAGYYSVIVTNSSGSATSSPALLTIIVPPAAPSITQQPHDLTITNNGTASFTNIAAGTAPLYYQWYFNTNTLVGGGTNAILTIAPATTNQAGYYSVIVTNSSGSATSSAAKLTVTVPIIAPTVTQQPQSLTITNGYAASFSVTATGTAPLVYQWYFNTNTVLAGQTSTNLTFSTTTNSGGYYTIVITNGGGAVTSSPALLTVVTATTPPIITVQPQPLTVICGNSANLSVTVSGRNPLKYQWYFNTNTVNTNLLGNLLASQTNAALTFTSATNSGGYYSVVVTNRLGMVTSAPPALLTVITKPIITVQPQSVTVTNGNSATFTSGAIGAGLLGFQWYFQTNTVVAGATNTTLIITNAGANLAGIYMVIVTNTYGRATSSLASLTVVGLTNQQPKILNFSFNPASGSFSLTLTNFANSVNRLWATTNLAATNFWSVIATNVMAANGIWFYTETNIAKTNNIRFYRFSAP